MRSCDRRLSLALGFFIIFGLAAPLDAAPFTLQLPNTGSALPVGPCWVEETIVPVQHARPKVRRRVVRPRAVHRPATVHRQVRPVRRHRPARIVSETPTRTLRWVCLPLRPPQDGIPPFAFDFAKQMSEYPADETFQQWIIDRPAQRRHHWRSEAVSTAPEPASWIMMVGGFLVAGWSVRRARRSAMTSSDKSGMVGDRA